MVTSMAPPLPEGWQWEFDEAAHRWRFIHLATNHIQSIFPNAGDEILFAEKSTTPQAYVQVEQERSILGDSGTASGTFTVQQANIAVDGVGTVTASVAQLAMESPSPSGLTTNGSIKRKPIARKEIPSPTTLQEAPRDETPPPLPTRPRPSVDAASPGSRVLAPPPPSTFTPGQSQGQYFPPPPPQSPPAAQGQYYPPPPPLASPTAESQQFPPPPGMRNSPIPSPASPHHSHSPSPVNGQQHGQPGLYHAQTAPGAVPSLPTRPSPITSPSAPQVPQVGSGFAAQSARPQERSGSTFSKMSKGVSKWVSKNPKLAMGGAFMAEAAGAAVGVDVLRNAAFVSSSINRQKMKQNAAQGAIQAGSAGSPNVQPAGGAQPPNVATQVGGGQIGGNQSFNAQQPNVNYQQAIAAAQQQINAIQQQAQAQQAASQQQSTNAQQAALQQLNAVQQQAQAQQAANQQQSTNAQQAALQQIDALQQQAYAQQAASHQQAANTQQAALQQIDALQQQVYAQQAANQQQAANAQQTALQQIDALQQQAYAQRSGPDYQQQIAAAQQQIAAIEQQAYAQQAANQQQAASAQQAVMQQQQMYAQQDAMNQIAAQQQIADAQAAILQAQNANAQANTSYTDQLLLAQQQAAMAGAAQGQTVFIDNSTPAFDTSTTDTSSGGGGFLDALGLTSSFLTSLTGPSATTSSAVPGLTDSSLEANAAYNAMAQQGQENAISLIDGTEWTTVSDSCLI